MTVVCHHSFVEDEIVLFFSGGQFNSLVGNVSLEEGRVLGGDALRIVVEGLLHGRFD